MKRFTAVILLMVVLCWAAYGWVRPSPTKYGSQAIDNYTYDESQDAIRTDEMGDPITPVYQEQSNNCMTIYNTGRSAAVVANAFTITVGGNDGSVPQIISCYIKPQSTTTACGFVVGATSVTFYTAAGLNAGSTYWIYTDTRMDTITEAINYWAVVNTTTTKGVGDGIVISTTMAMYGSISSSRLKFGAYQSCMGTSSVKYMEAKGATPNTQYCQVINSSIVFVQQGGFFPSTFSVHLPDTSYDTLVEVQNYLNALSTSTAGIEGGVVCSTTAGWMGSVASLRLTTTTAQNCKRTTLSLSLTPTTQTCTIERNVSSMTFTSSGSLTPGTTHIVYAEARCDTVGELIDVLNALPSTTLGIEGTLIATGLTGCYYGTLSEKIAPVAQTSILLTSVTVTYNDAPGMTVILPASDLTSGQRYHITKCLVNTTLTSGNAEVAIYYGTGVTTKKRSELIKNSLSGYDVPLDLDELGTFVGPADTAIRFDIVGSSTIANTKVMINGYRK